jgi:hypothetical protein
MLHCTATPEGRQITPEWLMDLFLKQNGWSKPGYRTMIDLDGRSHDLIEFDNDQDLEWSEVTYGASGFNSESIHISYAGGVSKWNVKIPQDTRTYEQRKALYGHVETTLSYHPDIKIGGHHMFNPHKACPSFDVVAWLNKIGVPEENIITQQVYKDAVIKSITDTSMFDFDPQLIAGLAA